jgi:CheY-like chemotaxis protein
MFDKEFAILVVEDNEMNQELIKIFFKKLQLKPIICSNGLEAVNYVTNKKPDLIFMDLHMPVMDGFEATLKIRELYKKEDLPVVVLTADAFLEQREESVKSGFNECLTKPIKISELNEIVDKYYSIKHPA